MAEYRRKRVRSGKHLINTDSTRVIMGQSLGVRVRINIEHLEFQAIHFRSSKSIFVSLCLLPYSNPV